VREPLRRTIEAAVCPVCDFPRPGLWIRVDEVEAKGRAPEPLNVWAKFHFLPEGSPCCCPEPNCHLALHAGRARERGVAERVRRALHLRQELSRDFRRITANAHAGVRLLVLEHFRRPGYDPEGRNREG
jgi:hypothetical protein